MSCYAPEFGRTPGGQISLVTRSGTNTAHGSVFEYFRHDYMDATDWFVNHRGVDRPKLRQQRLGGVLGGPIRRSLTFFFVSYEGQRLQQPRPATVNVPSVETPQHRCVRCPPVSGLVSRARELNHGGGLDYLSGVLTRLSPRTLHVLTFDWASDEHELVVAATPDVEGVPECRTDLIAIEREGHAMRTLVSQPGLDGNPAWSPEGQWTAFATSH
jgi:hypothetical protein